jgi:hypothetical protein
LLPEGHFQPDSCNSQIKQEGDEVIHQYGGTPGAIGFIRVHKDWDPIWVYLCLAASLYFMNPADQTNVLPSGWILSLLPVP